MRRYDKVRVSDSFRIRVRTGVRTRVRARVIPNGPNAVTNMR